MSDVLISIVVPIYNTPKAKLDACIEGLLKQTYRNYEVILVDDGSKEEIRQCIDSYACKDERIQVFHQKNGGVSIARNTGMDIAKGQYIAFVDADDCMNCEWLEKASVYAVKHNADIVFGKVVMCQAVPKAALEIGNYDEIRVFEGDELWRVQEALLLDETDMLSGLKGLDLGPCGKLFRRESIGENRFPIGIKLSEDQVFVHSVLKGSSKCVVTSAEAYYYIENAQSVSHSYHPDAVDVIEKAMFLVRECLFQRAELQQAYYFRVIDDMLNAMQFAYFCEGRVKVAFGQQLKGVQYAKSKAILAEALSRYDLHTAHSMVWKVKVCLLRYSPAMFVACKVFCRLMRRRNDYE